MQYDLIVDIDGNIHDPLTMKQPEMVASVFRLAREALATGKTVTIERRFSNAPSEAKAVFTTLDNFNAYAERLNDALRELSLPVVE